MNCVQSLIGSHSLDSQHSDMGCVLSLIGSGSVDLPQTLTPPSWILPPPQSFKRQYLRNEPIHMQN